MKYEDFFKRASNGHEAYPYQLALAGEAWPDLLDIPTGLGKTSAVTLAWLYKRGWRNGGRTVEPDEQTPRRLVWCLPMRVLVEQIAGTVESWLENLGVRGQAGQGRVSVHVLMGGESDLKSWAEHPEEDMIIIGTQDMLLSRALMRGYGMSRYQWPVQFALLHNDAMWAFDEVQLMGAGLPTSAQLEAFRRMFTRGRQSRSLWLSATLNPEWLETVDLDPYFGSFRRLELSDADRARAGQRLEAVKHLHQSDVVLTTENVKKNAAAYLDALCDAVLEAHDVDGQTLVILNRVDRAQGLFRRLKKHRSDAADILIHARFRPAERRAAEARLREAPEVDRIVVATQAIEAGMDISSRVLFTELAPWDSLVQRFGRCNRYGEHDAADVHWINIEEAADPLPYDAERLASARGLLEGLTAVDLGRLPAQHEPRPLTTVLRRKDFLELFNTDPDLSGFDVDVSDYIRDSGQPGVQVFWRDLSALNDPNEPRPQAAPCRDELCPVSMAQVKALLKKRSAWQWDSLDERWMLFTGTVRPGMTLLLAAKDGGYDPQLGAVADGKQAVVPLGVSDLPDQESFDSDRRATAAYAVSLPDHLGHVAEQADVLCRALDEGQYKDAVVRAARWHDVGKAHAVFDASMHRCDQAPQGLLAKSNCPGRMRHSRRHFRHELASALAWLAQHDQSDTPDASVDLVAYLIAAHHGKVRMSLRAMPEEPPAPDGKRFARGIWDGDELPALDFDAEHSTEVELKLALMELGRGEQGRSWAERTVGLLDTHGPFRLAWLETLVRIADWRASVAEQEVYEYE